MSLNPPTPPREQFSPPPSPQMIESPDLRRQNHELDKAYEVYRVERKRERIKLRQRAEISDTVPFYVADTLQLWIPTDLLAIVRSLWDPVLATIGHEQLIPLQVWASFVRTVFDARSHDSSLSTSKVSLENPNKSSSSSSISTSSYLTSSTYMRSSDILTPAARKLLLRLAFSRLEELLFIPSDPSDAISSPPPPLPPVALSQQDLRNYPGSPPPRRHTSVPQISDPVKTPNVHLATHGESNQLDIIRLYFEVRQEICQEQSIASLSLSAKSPTSALLRGALSGKLGLFAVWGGQGVQWLPELRTVYWTYPQARPLITRASNLLKTLAKSFKQHFSRTPLDLLSYLHQGTNPADPGELPPSAYLSSAPVSYASIGLTQLVQWYVHLLLLDIQPQDFLSSLKGVSGHSQGLLAAVVAAMSPTIGLLEENILMAVELLFCVGNRVQQLSPIPAIASPDVEHASRDQGWGSPTPMLAVFHLTFEVLNRYINMVNHMMRIAANTSSASSNPTLLLECGLINGPTALVVCGHPNALHNLLTLLHRAETPVSAKLDQSKIPHSKRKHEFAFLYLRVSAPFHHSSLADSLAKIREDAAQICCIERLQADQLAVPVYSPFDGQDLRHDAELLETVLRQIVSQPVNWQLALKPVQRESGITHLLDFGPGEFSGITSVCARNLEGAGIGIVTVGSFQHSPGFSFVSGKRALFEEHEVPTAAFWAEEYAPRLVRRESDGQLCVDTLMSRLLNKPPLMVAGMTPTTVSGRLVSAVLNAGYHVELAGGGLSTEAMFRQKIQEIIQATPSGTGISVNLLFLNPRLWNLQFPLIMALASEHIHIEGITIAAGIPTLERANELLQQCVQAGIQHISFKPGTVAQILAVLEIAEANPQCNIVLQWTGGRGGGHHSYEDFHQPILQTYAQIRRCANIVLVAGSGFGDAAGSFPYLSGEWSTRFARPRMPFDGILLGSRVMVALEAETAPEAKRLIVSTPGISLDKDWENSYESEIGGITTVRSELGEPIHKIATRGLRLWAEFDREFFAIANKEKRALHINERKDYIIQRLNADFQKVYFGQHLDGRVADLDELTYQEVLDRLIQLSYLDSKNMNNNNNNNNNESTTNVAGRWIHGDFAKRLYDFGLRVEERFTHADQPYPVSAAKAKSLIQLEANPRAWLQDLLTEFPQAKVQTLCQEDCDYFLLLCLQRGRKPVNFIPVIDGDLESWFKKDSLWQSEDLEAVQDRDVGRVVILQGPLSCAYSTVADEPVADILTNIHEGWIFELARAYPSPEAVPCVKTFSKRREDTVSEASIAGFIPGLQTRRLHTEEGNAILKVTVPDCLPLTPDALESWYQWLALTSPSWWRTLLISKHVFLGRRKLENHYRTLFTPLAGTDYRLEFSKDELAQVQVYRVVEDQEMLQLTLVSQEDAQMSLSIYHYVDSKPISLSFQFKHDADHAIIHDITPNRNSRVKAFYARIWQLAEAGAEEEEDPCTSVFRSTCTVDAEQVKAFLQSLHRTEDPVVGGAPLDYAIVLSWNSLIRPLLLPSIDGDLLQLVHLSNAFKVLAPLPDDDPFCFKVGTAVSTEIMVREIATVAAGERVTVGGVISTEGVPRIEIQSQFLFRGALPFRCPHFKRASATWSLTVDSQELLEILKSKSWLHLTPDLKELPFQLTVSTTTMERQSGASDSKQQRSDITVEGSVTGPAGESFGTIQYDAAAILDNPVSAFMQRYGHPVDPPVFFASSGYKMTLSHDLSHAPAENHTYARASGDLNPIHTVQAFAYLARLESTITHGMWTSANASRVVQLIAARGIPSRVLDFQANFVGMVQNRDEMRTQVRHVGMRRGDLLVEVETRTPSNLALKGSALIRSPTTAFIFTGQGSAEVGMGMGLYLESKVAKKVWDQAERHMLAHYGVSILQIVRENPKSITIHFGGQQGRKIRSNYQQLFTHIKDDAGQLQQLPLFPEIQNHTSSFTFRHPEGLLFATQFSQPALVLMELAAFCDMEDHGLIGKRCIFTGHSLGEYAAISAVAGVLSIESLVDIVFLRGMTMQNAVRRDPVTGRSPYGMIAVNPQRVHRSLFKEKELLAVIDQIVLQSGQRLLQVVNFNVIFTQYVVAGELLLLRALDFVLTGLTRQQLFSVDPAFLQPLITDALEQAAALQHLPLQRGLATIPLPGIDVPFHSRFLSGGVPAFREILRQRLDASRVAPDALVGRYIPNVVAEPFAVTKAYVELVLKATQSELLQALVDRMQQGEEIPSGEIAYSLLLELLAYQFASPVLWIQTQHLFFTSLNIERLVEVGPAPTLTTMAKRTLESGLYSTLAQREILWIGRDKKLVYFELDDPEEHEEIPIRKPSNVIAPPTTPLSSSSSSSSSSSTSTPTPPPTPSFVPTLPAVGNSGAQVADAPPSALLSLRILLALKLKKPLSAIGNSATIKDLVGGKSALQNELVGDLAKEFGSEPDQAAEMELEALAARLGQKYPKIGPVLSAMGVKAVSSKAPSNWPLSAVKSYIQQSFGLQELRTEAAIAHMLLSEPPQRLAADAELQAWVGDAVKDYAQQSGISLASPQQGNAAGASAAAAVVDSRALDALNAQLLAMAKQQIQALQHFATDDSETVRRLYLAERDLREASEARLQQWVEEHGESYIEGLGSVFDARKVRRFHSSWNWVRQDSLALYYDYAIGQVVSKWTSKIRERLYHLKNRATAEVCQMVEYYLRKASLDGYPEILSFITIFEATLRAALNDPPLYREFATSTRPTLQIDATGRVLYQEVDRPGIASMEHYVSEMKRGLKVSDVLAKSASILNSHTITSTTPSSSSTSTSTSTSTPSSSTSLHKVLDDLKQASVAASPEILGLIRQLSGFVEQDSLPYLFLRAPSGPDPSLKPVDHGLTDHYLSVLAAMAKSGCSFDGKRVLITGCGKGSIGAEILKGLLRGGAIVYATTSRPSNAQSNSYFQSIYDNHGAKGSKLIILPFNAASLRDVNALVKFIYDVEKTDLDIVIPFAATSENGIDISEIQGHSELSHRLMMTNVIRLAGCIMREKRDRGIELRPAHVLLPLSPNHGTFGHDGLYSESKLGLESLLQLWHSEGWSNYLTIVGAIIGWTRGTGLMNQNNLVAAGVEEIGARTFSAAEMSFNLIGLLHPDIVSLAYDGPILADLNGGLHLISKLNDLVGQIRKDINDQSRIQRAISADLSKDREVERGKPESIGHRVLPRTTLSGHTFPELPEGQRAEALRGKLRGMFDLSRVVVVTGFGEVGPWGSARTRWEMEAHGEFSIEGCFELAWLMGLIKYRKTADAEPAWVDAGSGSVVLAHEIKSRYEETILKHTGIRVVEPEILDGFDPNKKTLLHQVAVEHDLPPIEITQEQAAAFERQHGGNVAITTDGQGVTRMKLLKGAVIQVPKALRSDRFVAGQIPSSWDAATYGIPEDIIHQVDRVTLFTLVSTSEALIAAGVTNFYEFYKYVHLSEVGNAIGSGMGGATALRRIHKQRFLDESVQGDALQETFINTTAAWVNMLLVSAAGPIVTPVGACATAVESLDIGVQLIKSGKARMCLVGGFDDIGEESMAEFGSMRATANNDSEVSAGRIPAEMSRPATSTRAGFVESHGAGVELLTSAELALEMGLPIYCIVAHVATAMDKEGRSVPAPGQGILTTARERPTSVQLPVLDVEYRRQQLQRDLQALQGWEESERAAFTKYLANHHRQQQQLMETVSNSQDASSTNNNNNNINHNNNENNNDNNNNNNNNIEGGVIDDPKVLEELEASLAISVRQRERELKHYWSEGCFKQHPNIAPLRAALAGWGLSVDDINVASFHGTSTKANDQNESEVLQRQLEHLGRSKGNVVLTIFQKWLTGHPKGPAASWMLHGLIQSMLTGLLPGNRNADDVDEGLRKYDFIMYSSHPLQTYGFKAGLLKSFGFGQVGSEVLVLHPDMLVAQLSDQEMERYRHLRTLRSQQSFRHWQDAITGRAPFVQIKHHPPFHGDAESKAYLDPLCRASFDASVNDWRFNHKNDQNNHNNNNNNNNNNYSSGGVSYLSASSLTSASSSLLSTSSSSLPDQHQHQHQPNGDLLPASTSGSSLASGGSMRSGLRRNISTSALTQLEVTLREMGEGLRTKIDRGIGVDAQVVSEIEVSLHNSEWVVRNFTPSEINYCRYVSADPSSSFAGRFAAKEAVIKAISNSDMDPHTRNLWKGSGAPLVDIEILPSPSGAPAVALAGHAKEVADLLGISSIRIAISHSGEYAVAQAHVQ